MADGSRQRLVGEASVPGDKSSAHRALVLAALARGRSLVRGVPRGGDVAATRQALEALGTRFFAGPEGLVVEPATRWREEVVLDARNSGTTARLLAGALAARSCPATIVGDASLSTRPMERVAEPLRALGARVSVEEGSLPLTVRPATLRAARWMARVPSAQVKTAFLVAAGGARGESRYREEVATRDVGERLLVEFGAALRQEAGWWCLDGPSELHGTEVDVPGDPSAAAVLAVAAALLPGSDLTVGAIDLSPARAGFVGVLERMGARVERPAPRRLAVRGGAPLAGTRVTATEVPGLIDEVPLLVLAAAAADGESVFEGLSELRHKESDRLAASCELLEGLGVPHELEGDVLRVRGGSALRPCRLDPRGDHRFALLGAVLELVVPGSRCLRDGSEAVSWPTFHADLANLVRT